MLIATVTKNMTTTAAAGAKEPATATAMTMAKISQSYRDWQVPALGKKVQLKKYFHSN